jgi:hypothetical protein
MSESEKQGETQVSIKRKYIMGSVSNDKLVMESVQKARREVSIRRTGI